MDAKWVAEVVAYTLKCSINDVGVVKGHNLFIMTIDIGINETDYNRIVAAVEEQYRKMNLAAPLIRFLE